VSVATSNPAVEPNSLLLNIPAASAVLGLTVWQIRGLIANGEIPVIRVGKKLFLRRAALTRWAERSEGKHRVQHIRHKVSA
jgi:excisionase family DNA binding protein